LSKLIDSIEIQGVSYVHILLWDNKRDDEYLYPNSETLRVKNPRHFDASNRYSIVIPDNTVQGMAYG
jgi:hypothetical protein